MPSLVGAEVLKYLCSRFSPPFPSLLLPMALLLVECLEYLMAPDNLQQPPHELQLAEAGSGGGV